MARKISVPCQCGLVDEHQTMNQEVTRLQACSPVGGVQVAHR